MLVELPLFDSLGDELQFPFPTPTPANGLQEESGGPSVYRYAFDRPSHIRMLREGIAEGNDEEDRLFGHLVLAGDGEAVNSL